MDESGNTIKEIIDKVSEKVENGTTKTIKTKVNFFEYNLFDLFIKID